ncbi:hypothetical protein [Flavobacterium faecale]|uniref:hypothetical protein n=1 Tax=Flavobacterium faecale TaxID=1355330 RepID=UPI003AAC39BF
MPTAAVYTSNPPGIALSNVEVKLSGQISFSEPRSKTPLPALVEACNNPTHSEICISAVVFIDAAQPAPTLSVNQLYVISNVGTPQLQFFISYDLPETEAKNFKAYEVNFEASTEGLPEGVSLSMVHTVETFLWDTDPVASRGTTTVVNQP